jgi:hypothetical protein
MLDKAAGSYFPAILNERSELKSAFDGFTYYPNTVSYFRATLLGSPPLFGGYEYTPDKLHERKDESMRKKYNEACLVLPTFFRQKGFSASVFDLPYFDFQSRMNISLFSDRGIKAANFGNKFARRFFSEFKDRASPISGRVELLIRHNLVLFSVFMASPVFLRTIIYDNGNYWSAVDNVRLDIVLGTVSDNYSLLYYLPEITAVNNEEKNTFSLFVSNMAHDPSFLQYPDYTVVSEISDFGPDLFNGNIKSFQFYHVNAASYILLAKWFEFLKKQGVYDNTRIIIVSDHGESLVDPSGAIDRAYTPYNPILLFKDFSAKGELKTDFEFMTNADTPLLAVKDIFPGAKNPFTGKLFEADKENGVFVFLDGSSQPQDYPGNEVLDKTSHFYHIKENIFDAKNWTKTTKKY